MHEVAGVLHSGISISTIKYSRSDELWKLIDYSESMDISESLRTPRTTFFDDFQAPEVQRPGIFTTASDVYSLGKALYSLWFIHFKTSLFFDCAGERDSLELFRLFFPMIMCMQDENPQNRPTVVEALRYFYLTLLEKGPSFRKCDEFRFKSQQKICERVDEILLRDLLKAKIDATRTELLQEESGQLEANLAGCEVSSGKAEPNIEAAIPRAELVKRPTELSMEPEGKLPKLSELQPQPQRGH